MNILDIAILALLAFFVVRGLMQGLVREVMGLVGIVAALLLGVAFYRQAADQARLLLKMDAVWLDAAAFGAILLVVFAAVVYLGSMISELLTRIRLSPLNRLLGGGLGLIKGVLLAYLLLNLLLLLMPFNPPEQLRTSTAAPYVIQSGRRIMSLVPDNIIHELQEKSGLLGPSTPAPAENSAATPPATTEKPKETTP